MWGSGILVPSNNQLQLTLLSFSSCKRYKYTYMEEMLGNVAGCRQVFERWMEWEPDEQAWHSYINFELRYKEVDKARTIYERYILLLCVCVLSRVGV